MRGANRNDLVVAREGRATRHRRHAPCHRLGARMRQRQMAHPSWRMTDMRSNLLIASAGITLALALTACNQDEFSREEATEALDEVSADGQAGAVTDAPIEISTHFTLGGAV